MTMKAQPNTRASTTSQFSVHIKFWESPIIHALYILHLYYIWSPFSYACVRPPARLPKLLMASSYKVNDNRNKKQPLSGTNYLFIYILRRKFRDDITTQCRRWRLRRRRRRRRLSKQWGCGININLSCNLLWSGLIFLHSQGLTWLFINLSLYICVAYVTLRYRFRWSHARCVASCYGLAAALMLTWWEITWDNNLANNCSGSYASSAVD